MQHVQCLAKTRCQQQYSKTVPRIRRGSTKNMRKDIILGGAGAGSVAREFVTRTATGRLRITSDQEDRSLYNWTLAIFREHTLANFHSTTVPIRLHAINGVHLHTTQPSSYTVCHATRFAVRAVGSCPRPRLARAFGAGRRSYSIPSALNETRDEFTIPSIPTRVLKARADVVRRVNSTLQASFGRRYNVELFGSTCYGTDTADSDLDMVLLDSKRPRGLKPIGAYDTLLGPYDVRAVAAALERTKSLKDKSTPMFINIVPIPKANVAIVKFEDSLTGLSCDLNVNDRLGVINTGLIRRYCELSELLRPMLYVIKFWARSRGMNDPSASPATPSSFAYAMMTIAFLQLRGLLPNLQEGHDGVWPDDDHCIWFRKTTRHTGRDVWARCDVHYSLHEGWKPARDTPSLREALIDWFSYWASEHDYRNAAASVRDGGMIPKVVIAARHSADNENYTKILPDEESPFGFKSPDGCMLPRIPEVATTPEVQSILEPPLCVHDPFIRAKNLTVSISRQAVKVLKEECQAASESLQTGLPIQLLYSHEPQSR